MAGSVEAGVGRGSSFRQRCEIPVGVSLSRMILLNLRRETSAGFRNRLKG